jgi:DNA modification methylase
MKLVKISEVKPNPKNPRIIKDGKFQKLVKSIQEFPDMLNKRPLVVFTDVDNKYVVLGGNMRLKACKEIGLKEIPVIIADEWTEEQKAEFLIKDNVGFGEWDWDSLANEWDVEKLDDWGLDLPIDLSVKELEAEEDEFDVPEGGIETDIVLGDLFEIGEHRLLCGDSTDSDAVSKLMKGEKADMVFTDPPYGMGYKSNGWDSKKTNLIGNKNDEKILGDENTTVGIDAIRLTSLFIKENVHLFFWCRWDSFSDFANVASEFSNVKGNIVWDKGDAPGLGDLDCSFGGNEMAVHSIVGRRKIKKRINSVWKVNRPKGLTMVHPTQKPIEIIEPAIDNCTDINDLLLDLFLGSGSTMVASHQLKRKCYGMELDPKYCQVIIDRMKKLDPSLVIKKNGVEIK